MAGTSGHSGHYGKSSSIAWSSGIRLVADPTNRPARELERDLTKRMIPKLHTEAEALVLKRGAVEDLVDLATKEQPLGPAVHLGQCVTGFRSKTIQKAPKNHLKTIKNHPKSTSKPPQNHPKSIQTHWLLPGRPQVRLIGFGLTCGFLAFDEAWAEKGGDGVRGLDFPFWMFYV